MRTLPYQTAPSPTLVAAMDAARTARTARYRSQRKPRKPATIAPPTPPTLGGTLGRVVPIGEPMDTTIDPASPDRVAYNSRMVQAAYHRAGIGKRIAERAPYKGIGTQYADILASGIDRDSALVEVYGRAVVSAYRQGKGRALHVGTLGERMVRDYGTVAPGTERNPNDDWCADNAADIIIRILESEQGIVPEGKKAPEQTTNITMKSTIGRNDYANNKASRYWQTRYYVRWLFVVTETGEYRSADGCGWVPIDRSNYRKCRKLPIGHCELYEYRFTPNTLTETDHEGGRLGTGYDRGSPDVVAAISTLSDTERTALTLYSRGANMATIQRALFGMGSDGRMLGTRQHARKIVRMALVRVQQAVSQKD